MYYHVSQITLPKIEESYQRLIDMRPGETLQLKDRSYVLLNIERTGANVEPVYNLESSDQRVSMRIVNGNALVTIVNKKSFGIENVSIPVSEMGWVKRAGFYNFRRRDVIIAGEIRGEPLRDGDSFEIHKGCGRYGSVVASSGEPSADKREYIAVSFNSPREGNHYIETIFHSVKMEQTNYQLQKVCGDIVYVNNFMENNLKHIA